MQTLWGVAISSPCLTTSQGDDEVLGGRKGQSGTQFGTVIRGLIVCNAGMPFNPAKTLFLLIAVTGALL